MDGVEQEFQGKLKVIRVNVQDPVGRALVDKYGFEYTPTFIYFNHSGEEIWRSVGELRVERIRESLP